MNLNRVVTTLARPFIRVFFRPEVHGRAHLPEGGFVVCANHLSGFDAFAIAYALGRGTRNMAKDELFLSPVLGVLLGLLGAFPAHHGGVRRATALAARGDVVVIFPEGARKRPGQVHPPQKGAARTAIAASVPVVPVALSGIEGWRHLRRWQITIGAPLSLDDLGSLPPAVGARQGTKRLWGAISELGALA